MHAHMHAWHGGTWDCAVGVQAWLGEHADVPESIARFIVQNVGDTWLDYGTAGRYSCPMSNACDLDTPLDECACSSFLDLESEAQRRAKVDNLLNSTLHQWHGTRTRARATSSPRAPRAVPLGRPAHRRAHLRRSADRGVVARAQARVDARARGRDVDRLGHHGPAVLDDPPAV